jgi:hypothetical protein
MKYNGIVYNLAKDTIKYNLFMQHHRKGLKRIKKHQLQFAQVNLRLIMKANFPILMIQRENLL